MVVLEAENVELKEKIKGVTTTVFKGKNEANSLQLELENKLHTAEMKITLMGTNLKLDADESGSEIPFLYKGITFEGC
ncbi:hypothetical protein KY284_016083 [Solanum tuberosum]|nr:hypothetical protein KY284_016083 [Solanum tuberosum]